MTVLTKGINITDGTRFQLINNNSGFIDADTKDVLTEEDLKKLANLLHLFLLILNQSLLLNNIHI